MGGDAGGAVVQVALADVDATESNQGGGAEIKFLCTEQGGDDDILPCAYPPIGSKGDAVAKTVKEKNLLGFGNSQLPRTASIFNGRERRGSRAPVVASDQNDIGVGFGHAGGDGADTSLSDQLDAYFGARIDLFEVVNKLGEIFDAINIVMGRRRDESDARCRAAEGGDERGDFMTRKLSALAWFSALGNLDFQLGGAGKIFGSDPEAGGSDLLDSAIFRVAILHGGKASPVFATFT